LPADGLGFHGAIAQFGDNSVGVRLLENDVH
jgi:hypothetical protein